MMAWALREKSTGRYLRIRLDPIPAVHSHNETLPAQNFDTVVLVDRGILINGADSWSANPFVWVIRFRKVDLSAAIK